MTDIVELRRWLGALRRPDRLGSDGVDGLLAAHGRMPPTRSPRALGDAAAALLAEAIERLRAADGADPQAALPYVVLRSCFLERAKAFQVANRLGISERQLSRERTRAIELLCAELDASLPGDTEDLGRPYRPPPLPAIDGYLTRLAVTGALRQAAEGARLVLVTGPAGIGKTSLVADFLTHGEALPPVLWYRVRPGVTDSLTGLLYEVGEFRRAAGQRELADYFDGALAHPDLALASRIALRALDGEQQVLVLDDFHLVEQDERICGFLDEATSRLDGLTVFAITRHFEGTVLRGAWFTVPPLTRGEVRKLLAHLGVRCTPETAALLHEWTNGVPQLVTLAAAWLKTTDPDRVVDELPTLATRAHVQDFLLSTITGLLDPDDRAVLAAASIFRDRFSDDALAAVSTRTRGTVLDASRRLLRAHVATRSLDGQCAFFHTTVRDYVYERLASDERAELHTRAASWFAGIGAGDEVRYHSARAAVVSAPPAVPARGGRRTRAVLQS